MLPEFRITVCDLADLDTCVVELSGELDIVSAGFLSDVLVEVASEEGSDPVRLEAWVSPEQGDFVVTTFILGFGGRHWVHRRRGHL